MLPKPERRESKKTRVNLYRVNGQTGLAEKCAGRAAIGTGFYDSFERNTID
jgi:hypothetical protein